MNIHNKLPTSRTSAIWLACRKPCKVVQLLDTTDARLFLSMQRGGAARLCLRPIVRWRHMWTLPYMSVCLPPCWGSKMYCGDWEKGANRIVKGWQHQYTLYFQSRPRSRCLTVANLSLTVDRKDFQFWPLTTTAATAWLLTINAIDFLIIHHKLEIKTVHHNHIFTAASYLHLYIHVVSVSQLMHFLFHRIWSEWYGQGFEQRDGVGTRRCKGYVFGCSFGRIESRLFEWPKTSVYMLTGQMSWWKGHILLAHTLYMLPKIFARSVYRERGIFRNIMVNFYHVSLN